MAAHQETPASTHGDTAALKATTDIGSISLADAIRSVWATGKVVIGDETYEVSEVVVTVERITKKGG